MSRQQKIHSTLSEHFIPETGTFGDVWLAKAEQSFWYATRDGRVVNLSDVLNQVPVHTPPRHGKDGRDAVSVKGERGERGEASTVPGPAGRNGIDGSIGAVGLRGERGERGEASVVPGHDSAFVLADTLAAISKIHGEFEALKLVVEAIHGQNKQVDDYLNYLRAKRAAKK